MTAAPPVKGKRGRPRKAWPTPGAHLNDTPPDYGNGRKLEGKEFDKRKKVLEDEDRDRRRPK